MIARQFSTSNGPGAFFPSTCFEPSCGRIEGTLEYKQVSLQSFLGDHDDMIKPPSRRNIPDSDMFNDTDASTISSDDMVPRLPRRKPEQGGAAACINTESPPPFPTNKRTIRDISKLRRSPQLSRLRRQKDMYGEESR